MNNFQSLRATGRVHALLLRASMRIPKLGGTRTLLCSLALAGCYIEEQPSGPSVRDRRSASADGTDGAAPGPAPREGAPAATDPTDSGAPSSGTTPMPPSGAGTSPPTTAKGIFVAVGYGARRVRTLDDGATWVSDQSDVPNGGDDLHLIRDVAWGGGQWVTGAGFQGKVKTSADAVTWATQPSSIGQWLGGLAYANGTWVAVGGYGRRSRSVDGAQTWTDLRDDGAPNGFRGLALGTFQNAPRWVGVGDGGRVTYTSDGAAWQIGTGVPSNAQLREVASGAGVFVALAEGSSTAYRSTDGGATWMSMALPATGIAVAWGNGRFVVAGSGRAFVSTNGATWTSHDAAALGGPIAFGNGVFLALKGRSSATSPDGAVWTVRGQLPESANGIERVRFGGQQ